MAFSLSTSCLKKTRGPQCLLAPWPSPLQVREPDPPQGQCSGTILAAPHLKEKKWTLSHWITSNMRCLLSTPLRRHLAQTGSILVLVPNFTSVTPGRSNSREKMGPCFNITPPPQLFFSEKNGSSMDAAVASLPTWFFMPSLFISMLTIPMKPHEAERLRHTCSPQPKLLHLFQLHKRGNKGAFYPTSGMHPTCAIPFN